jgi:hypothetical protein
VAQCIEGDESGQVGDWNTKIKNCLTDEERVVVKECFDNRSKDLLLKVGIQARVRRFPLS